MGSRCVRVGQAASLGLSPWGGTEGGALGRKEPGPALGPVHSEGTLTLPQASFPAGLSSLLSQLPAAHGAQGTVTETQALPHLKPATPSL